MSLGAKLLLPAPPPVTLVSRTDSLVVVSYGAGLVDGYVKAMALACPQRPAQTLGLAAVKGVVVGRFRCL